MDTNHKIRAVLLTCLLVASLACSILIDPFGPPATQELDVTTAGWQRTALDISGGQQVTIEVIAGKWFEDPPGTWHDADGGPNPWTCGNPACHEPLPDTTKYALIAKLGETGQPLPVGARLVFVAGQSGRLYLGPNYGAVDIPIFKPQGSLRVRITAIWP